MQTAATAKKPGNTAFSGHFRAGRTYRGRIKDDHKIDLAMVSGGTVVRETGGCVMGQIEKQHVHHYIKIGEDWISPPGGVYVSYHLQCTECGHDYWSEYENMLK